MHADAMTPFPVVLALPLRLCLLRSHPVALRVRRAAELAARGDLESDLSSEREARRALETQMASMRSSVLSHNREVGARTLELAAVVACSRPTR